jgi:hypothetical protein
MLDVKIGDVVEGFGWSRNKQCRLIVDRIRTYEGNDVILGVSGRVIDRHGRITSVQENIPVRDMIKAQPTTAHGDVLLLNIPRVVKKKGGWTIIPGGVTKSQKPPLASQIKSLEIGQTIHIDRDDYKTQVCRVTASQAKDDTGNTYRVSKTQLGCDITRTE